MKEDLVRKFVEKLDYSYNYKTANERENIINELCEIAGIEHLIIPTAVCNHKKTTKHMMTGIRYCSNPKCQKLIDIEH